MSRLATQAYGWPAPYCGTVVCFVMLKFRSQKISVLPSPLPAGLLPTSSPSRFAPIPSRPSIQPRHLPSPSLSPRRHFKYFCGKIGRPCLRIGRGWRIIDVFCGKKRKGKKRKERKWRQGSWNSWIDIEKREEGRERVGSEWMKECHIKFLFSKNVNPRKD